MYYPIQVPYILNTGFSRHVAYSEEVVDTLSDFAICLWDMRPRTGEQRAIKHVILADGCIDLVVDFDAKRIGYAGMSRTDFHDLIPAPARFFGARLKPGAFQLLTGLPASRAMDKALSLYRVDPSFDTDAFFALPFDEAKVAFRAYLEQLVSGKEPNEFVQLFDRFSLSPPATTAELYQALHLSPRQCQRLFLKHFALTPQMALSILRFQHCLARLTSAEATPRDILDTTAYYDQSHLIKDFKRNIGLTPFEYLNTLKMSHLYKTDLQPSDTLSPYSNKQEEHTMQFTNIAPRICVRKNYGACLEFYEKLGLVPNWNNSAGDRNGPYTSLAATEDGPECLALFAAVYMPEYKGYTPPTGNAPTDTIELSFASDDVDADYKRLKEAGIEFIGEPQTMAEWGMRCVWLRDPEGNLLEIAGELN